MVTFSIIQKSQLEGAHRLDAEYYQPEYLRRQISLARLNPEPLSEHVRRMDVGFVSSMASHFVDHGVPLLRTQNIREFSIDYDSDLVQIDEGFHRKLKKSQVHSGYVLLARSGSIGEAAVVPHNIEPTNSADIILIEPKDELLPEYLAGFLNSEYGRFQIDRGSSGGLQGHINLYSLEKVLLPTLSLEQQLLVKDAVVEGVAVLKRSKQLYAQAEELLLQELGLKGARFGEDLAYTVRFPDIKTAERMDADYFQPKYKKLQDALQKHGAQGLSEVVEDVPAKFDPAKKPQDMFRYVELSNINASLGVIDGYSEVSGKEAPSRAKRVLKAGDVIVSSVEGSLEKSALVDKEQENFLASTGFFQLRSSNVLPEVLLIIAKSIVFQWQLKQKTAGTILTAVPKESIKTVLVPILPKPIQQKIADLVRRSHEARKKSKELLESAKHKVEELIEGGQK